ncbi:MAG: Alkylated repair protein [Daejeonella sp.]|nr:Alkylated repair protein [Daejeonella sp.]
MFSLFPNEPTNIIEGFTYLPNFISPREEALLLAEISKLDLHTFMFQGYEAKRKVASLGYDWNFESRTLNKGKDIPQAFDKVLQETAEYLGLQKESFAEVLVTEYPVGSVINWHRDAPSFDLIAGISLLSDCRLRLRPQEKSQQIKSQTKSFQVERCSLYVMQGPARSEWQHSISPVKNVRYSITLRTLKSLYP